MTPDPSVDLRTSLGGVPTTFAVVTVTGPDAAAYLQGQLSQDVAALSVGDTAPALLLQPTGKLTAWLRVQRTAGDAYALVVDAAVGEEVLARLRRFKLRTDAELELTERAALAVRGPGAGEVGLDAVGVLRLPAGWPGVDGVDLLAEPDGAVPDVGVPEADPTALEVLRIEAGVPAMGADLTDATIPAEGGQWLIDASVSFTKGCYTGQELVARIDSRGGNVPRPVRGLRIDGDAVVAVGAAVLVDGTEVGAVTSAARSSALGWIALAPMARSVELAARVAVVTAAGSTEATVVALPMR